MNEDIFRAMLHFAVQQARLITDDQEALEVKCLYKEWEVQIGRELSVGEYVQYNGQLFRVLQTHIAQVEWIPGKNTESLYVVIDKEHKGTIVDPIPWKVNMEAFAGKYYIENEILYLCTRDSGIALQYTCVDLVGVYFEIVAGEGNGDEAIEGEGNGDEVIEGEGNGDEVIEGTLDNPIIIEDCTNGVNFEEGKYYLYSVDEKIYLCTRSGLLYHVPSALVGTYFEIVE